MLERVRKMKKWKIVLWLVFFFPVGLYLMFKHSGWPQKVKAVISLFFLIVTLGTFGLLGEFMYLSGFMALIVGIYTLFKKKDKKRSLILLAIGTFLFATTATANYQVDQTQERERIAIELEEQKEAERIIQEKHEKELAAKAEQKRIEEEKIKAQEELKQRAVKAVEKVEKNPSKQNYDQALLTLNKLDEKDPLLTSRLDKAKPIMEKYEEDKLVVIAAVEKAEGDKTRSSYDEAHGLVTALAFSNSSFTNRLSKLDGEITVIEKEKVAAEKVAAEKKEAERIAAEAEAIRIEAEAEAARVVAAEAEAARVAEVEAEAERVAAEEAAAVVVAPVENQIANVVYIAPQSGAKYHYHSNCRGLSNANSIVEMDLSTAQSQGYELCGWED